MYLSPTNNKDLSVLAIAVIVISSSIGIFYLLEPRIPLFCSIFTIPKAEAQTECNYYPQAYYYDGILQLYKHKQGYGIWSLEQEKNLGACPYNSECTVVPAGGGWYKDEGPQNNIRNEVPSDPSFQRPGHHLGTYDQNIWRQYGYMESPKDWKNVEVSALYYLPPGTTKDIRSFGPPGVDYVIRGSVNEDRFPQTCLAQNYHVGVFTTDDGAKVERDIEHTAGYNQGQITGYKLNPNGIPPLPIGKVFGFKVVLYNSVDNSKVRIDAYLDQTGSGHDWKLIYSYIDDGHKIIDSVRGNTQCPGLRPDLPVTFGGPFVGLRLNWAGAYFRQLVIQEIVPPRW